MRARLAIGIVGVWAVAAAIVILIRTAERTTINFPDGTRLIFLGSAFGTNKFTTERWWQRTAKKILPASMHRKLPAAFTTGGPGSATNSLRLHFAIEGPSAGNLFFDIVDDHGFRFYQRSSSEQSDRGVRFVHYTLQAFPRRQPNFDLVFFDRSRTELGRLRVSNPVKGPFPVWKAEPLPITKTSGPVTLTLKGLRRMGNGPNGWVSPEWEVRADEPSWENALRDGGHWRDATGNEGWSLSPREPVWRIRPFLQRRTYEADAPNERFLLLTNVEVPPPGKFLAFHQSHAREGVTVRVIALAGAGILLVSNASAVAMHGISSPVQEGFAKSAAGLPSVESWGRETPFLVLEVDGLAHGDFVRFFLRGEEGPIPLETLDVIAENGRSLRGIAASNDVKQVTLEALVSRGHWFEFFIDPAELEAHHPDMRR